MKTLAQAEKFLLTLPKSGAAVFRGGAGLDRSRKFLELLGNPQNAFKSVHIAGTSGKGSVGYLTATLLHAAGQTVGLNVSPHVVSVTERIQINGRPIGAAEFVRLLNDLTPAVEQMKSTGYGGPTYFEVVTALAYLAFKQAGVDYAVIETGLGGTYDMTNLVTRPDKLAVITQIGLDHTAILGETISEIAAQKAGIIQAGNQVLALDQEPTAVEQFQTAARAKKADLELFETPKRVQHIHPSLAGTEFNFKFKPWIWRQLVVGLIGRHQAVNSGLALRAVQILAERDGFELDEATARKALSELRIPARFEIRQKRIIIDGAHNAQKLERTVEVFQTVFPRQKATILLAMKKDKDTTAAIRELLPIADHFIVTSFFNRNQDLENLSEDPEKLAGTIKQLGAKTKVIADPHQALQATLKSSELLLITGSFYFIGEIYKELP